MMARQTDNRTKGSISVKGVDCEIGTNEGLQRIQIVMTQDILVVITQSNYITAWALHGSHSYTDPDTDTSQTIMTQSAEVSGLELHETYSCQDLNMTPNGEITPSPRPRGNLTQRFPQWFQQFPWCGSLTPRPHGNLTQ